MLMLKLWLLNIPHGKVSTGGGIIKIRKSRHGSIILGDNINFANRWEIGYPIKCFLRVSGNGVLKIGDYTGLNSVQIFCDESIIIGNHVLIGGGTTIFDTNFHNTNFLCRRLVSQNCICKTSPIVIGDDVFIGGKCIISKGVTIGNRSMVAAGSVIVKSIPEDELWGGNPAVFIKKINQKNNEKRL
jgi:acetyltransferase-like isoleucine patch superfamily enzyme